LFGGRLAATLPMSFGKFAITFFLPAAFAAAVTGDFLAAVFFVAVFADGFVAAAFFVPDFMEVCGFFAAVGFLAAGFFAFGPVFALTFAIIYPFLFAFRRNLTCLLHDTAILP
jgi:hypothetical protein